MSQTGCFVGWFFLFNVELSIFLICNTPLVYFLFFVLFFYMSLTRLYLYRNPILVFLWSLQLVCSQTLEYQEPMPFSCSRCAVIITQSPVLQQCSLLYRSHQRGPCPPLLRSQAHHQPLTGNRSESRWVTTLREGESEQRLSRQQGRHRGSLLNETRGERCGEDEEMSHVSKNISTVWLVYEDTFCFLFSW